MVKIREFEDIKREVNQEWITKIKRRIEFWDIKISKGIVHNDIDLEKWKFVKKELKSLLENEVK